MFPTIRRRLVILILLFFLILTQVLYFNKQNLKQVTQDYLIKYYDETSSPKQPQYEAEEDKSLVNSSDETYNHEFSDDFRVISFDNPEVNTNYLELLQKYGSQIVQESTESKCFKYFDTLYENNSNYSFELFENESKGWSKQLFETKKNYINQQINEIKKSNKDFELNKEEELRLEIKYLNDQEIYNELENKMIDMIRNVKIFNHCYSKNSKNLDYYLTKNSNFNIENKIYPWLSRKYPIFTRWNGFRTNKLPNFKELHEVDDIDINSLKESLFEEETSDFHQIPNAQSFLTTYFKEINSKGIVISIADKFVDDTMKLIKTLRATGNKLPIEIIHKGDLSIANQLKIIKIARTDSISYPKFELDSLKNIKYSDLIEDFPKQDVWFVNLKYCIKEEFQSKFNSYSNKLLAYLFNSFDEMLLIDSDLVPYVNTEYFFQTSQYKANNCLFYKDRSIQEPIFDHDVNFWEQMMTNDLDEIFFNLNPITKKTLNNRYLGGKQKHYMESGVIAQKRSKYWEGIPLSIQLTLWITVTERIWGDKELFWLIQSIMGNENYEFNEYNVAAVGEFMPKKDNQSFEKLCATHPGHISSDDDKLVWLNSGVMTCKRTDAYERDFKAQQKEQGFETELELKKFYESPLKIINALVPPDKDLEKIEDDIPNKGWEPSELCWGYFWCAYSRVNNSDLPENNGITINFSQNEVLWHNYIGKIYIEEWQLE